MTALPRHLRPHVQPLPLHEPRSRSCCSCTRSSTGAGGAGPPGRRRRCALVATQPYGVLVLAAEVVYVGVLRLRGPLPLRRPLVALAAVLVLAIPLWRTYALLASRFDVGVGESSSELGSPLDVVRYLGEVVRRLHGRPADRWRSRSRSSPCSGWSSLARRRPETALLTAARGRRAGVALLAAGSGPGVSLESRHLIFLLPFATMAVAAGILRLGRLRRPGRARRSSRRCSASSSPRRSLWGIDRTRWLYTGEPSERAEGRDGGGALAAPTSSRADDVLFGYEPTYLDAWEEGAPFGDDLRPARRRDARPRGARGRRRAARPRGVGARRLGLRRPVPGAADDPGGRRPGRSSRRPPFGPFLVVRTVEPTLTPAAFLQATLDVQALGARSSGSATRAETRRPPPKRSARLGAR